MTEAPDRQPDFIVDGVAGHPLVTVPRHTDTADVGVTGAQRWEYTDGSVFAFVTREEWPRDGSGWGIAS